MTGGLFSLFHSENIRGSLRQEGEVVEEGEILDEPSPPVKDVGMPRDA
jgi:hypothetical protein